MSAPRSRRLARIAILSTAVIGLLASGYVSSYFGMFWLSGHGIITGNTSLQLQQTVYCPVSHYIGSSGPGSESARRLTIWVHSQGSGGSAAWNSIDGTIVTGGHPHQLQRTAHSPDEMRDR